MGSTKLTFLSLILVSAILPGGAAAQTWDEFFSQGEKQREYDREQLSAAGIGWVRTVAIKNSIKFGLEAYMNSEEGNFNLYRDFFGRLKDVNPDIANSAKVIDIVVFQHYITRDMGKIWNFCSSNRDFAASEIRYIEKVHANFIVLTDANISELIRIVAPGEATMTDAERMMQIDRLYEEQLDQHAFVREFGQDVFTLARERQKEESSLNGYGWIIK